MGWIRVFLLCIAVEAVRLKSVGQGFLRSICSISVVETPRIAVPTHDE
jgi:hypothetical protein